jgi:hypothetical protein
MNAVAEEEIAPRRQQMVLLVTFAAPALIVASLGIYRSAELCGGPPHSGSESV